jgi:hypothetical protein
MARSNSINLLGGSMRAKAVLLICLSGVLMLAVSAWAQEGHPLKGSWLGDWGPSKADRNQVVVVMDWDGKQITGQINPGPNAIQITKATLEPKGWLVHLEADAKNAAGKPVHYVIEGKIENLGLYNRSIVGTWDHDNVKGDFKITRQ